MCSLRAMLLFNRATHFLLLLLQQKEIKKRKNNAESTEMLDEIID